MIRLFGKMAPGNGSGPFTGQPGGLASFFTLSGLGTGGLAASLVVSRGATLLVSGLGATATESFFTMFFPLFAVGLSLGWVWRQALPSKLSTNKKAKLLFFKTELGKQKMEKLRTEKSGLSFRFR